MALRRHQEATLSSMLGHRHHGAASCGGRGWQRRPALLRTEAEQAEGPGHIGLAVERGAAELARHALAAAEHDGALGLGPPRRLARPERLARAVPPWVVGAADSATPAAPHGAHDEAATDSIPLNA